MGERSFGAEAAWIVARAGQQLAGGLGTDAGQGDEPGSGLGDQRPDLLVRFPDLFVECLVAAGQAPQRGLHRAGGVLEFAGWAGAGQGVDQLTRGQFLQPVAHHTDGAVTMRVRIWLMV
ncbi:hypothetical protein [Streptomyces sp. NBC_00162]|uniref:hypothetical protein n=1 Tax=Streptomyces sp. NBC_00162 TaxID=2903629 RepID=UPI003A4C6130